MLYIKQGNGSQVAVGHGGVSHQSARVDNFCVAEAYTRVIRLWRLFKVY